MCRYMQKELIRVGILKKCPTIQEKKHHQFFENVPKIQHLFVPKITNMFSFRLKTTWLAQILQ